MILDGCCRTSDLFIIFKTSFVRDSKSNLQQNKNNNTKKSIISNSLSQYGAKNEFNTSHLHRPLFLLGPHGVSLSVTEAATRTALSPRPLVPGHRTTVLLQKLDQGIIEFHFVYPSFKSFFIFLSFVFNMHYFL